MRRDVIISAEAQEIFSWNVTDTAAMLYADTEITRIIEGLTRSQRAEKI